MFDRANRDFSAWFAKGSTGPMVGPGRYTIPRLFGEPDVKQKTSEVKSQPKSVTDLLRELDSDYDLHKERDRPPPQVLTIFRKPKPKVPFLVTGPRVQPPVDPEKCPPPVGTYNYGTFLDDMPKKRGWHKYSQVAFETTHPKSPSRWKPPPINPGPGQYNIKSVWKKEDNIWSRQSTPPFASRVPRVLFTPKEGPAVGQYNVAEAHQRKIERKEFHNAEFDGKQGVAFNLSAPRVRNEIPINERKVSTYRGPGRYDVKTEQKVVGVTFTKDKRFRYKYSDTPGPGTYELSPYYEHTVMKKSFNKVAQKNTLQRTQQLFNAPNFRTEPQYDMSWIDEIDPRDYGLQIPEYLTAAGDISQPDEETY